MTTGPRYPRIAFLLSFAPLLLAIPLAAEERDDKQAAISLTVEPANTTLNTGQAQRFSAELKGAPPTTVINWAVRERGGDIGQDGVFTAEEKALVSAIAGFGAVAVAHAELYATAHAQAHELHQLLEISSELSSSSDLEHFLQAFVVRASDFLGFGRCFIALHEDGQFRVRYGVEKGEPRRLEVIFPEGLATRSLRGIQGAP